MLLTECPATECEQELEVTPTAEELSEGRVWYAMTPDLDVYPHIFSSNYLDGFVELKNDGSPNRETELGRRWTRARPVYGGEWEPTALELCEGLQAARPNIFDTPPKSKPPRRVTAKGPPGVIPSAAGSPMTAEEVFPGLVAGVGTLPAVSGLVWHVMSAEDPKLLRRPVSVKFDGFVANDRIAFGVQGADTYLMRAVDPNSLGVEFEGDARILQIKSRPDGSRHRHFTEAAREVSTTSWPEWPVLGPRTATWCLEFLARQDQHPRARHTKWVHECRLEQTDEGVGDHDLAMRMIELALSFDQLNVGELASFELLLRKAQMAEWRHRDRLAAVAGDELLEQSYLYLGTGETRGLVMVAPSLIDHINTEMHREAQILKERRKAKEERMLQQSGGGSGPGGGGGSKAELQKKVQQQAAELKRLQDRAAAAAAGGKDTPAGRGAGRPQ